MLFAGIGQEQASGNLVVGGRQGRVYDQKHGPNFQGEPTWGMIVIVELPTKCFQFDIISPAPEEWAKHETEAKLLLSTVRFNATWDRRDGNGRPTARIGSRLQQAKAKAMTVEARHRGYGRRLHDA